MGAVIWTNTLILFSIGVISTISVIFLTYLLIRKFVRKPLDRTVAATRAITSGVALGAVDILHASEPLQPPVTFGVKTEVVGPGLDLAWEPSAGTSWYRLYRGNLATLRSGGYDHAVVPDGCYLSAPQASLMDDMDSPVAFYYLVNSVAEDETVGPAGAASNGIPRPAGFDSCP